MPKLALTADVRYRQTAPIEIDFGGGSGFNVDRVKTSGLGPSYSF
jgi:hypothetical protein